MSGVKAPSLPKFHSVVNTLGGVRVELALSRSHPVVIVNSEKKTNNLEQGRHSPQLQASPCAQSMLRTASQP